MLDGVRHALASEEVGGRLDAGCEPFAGRFDLDRERRPARELPERCRQPGVELRRTQSPCELAQLVDGALDFRHSAVEGRSRLLGVLVTFHLVLLGWMCFRANSLADLQLLANNLVNGLGVDAAALWQGDLRHFYWTLVLALGLTRTEFVLSVGLAAFLWLSDWFLETEAWRGFAVERLPHYARLAFYDSLIFATLFLGVFGQKQFIYFQF